MLEPGGRNIISSKRSDNNAYFYNYDIRGSVTNIVDDSDDVVKSYDYEAYGKTTGTGYEYDEYGNLEENETQGFLNETTYTGSVTDKSTGLQYMSARYYDSENGRFLTQDTYTGNPYDPWTQHLYSYCGNNPTSMVDPTGHFFWFVVAAVVLTVGVTAIEDVADDGKINRHWTNYVSAGLWGVFDGLAMGQASATRKAAGTIAKETVLKQSGKPGAKSVARAGAGAIDDAARNVGKQDAKRWTVSKAGGSVAKSLTKERLVNSANTIVKGNTTAVGRAFQKHAVREGTAFTGEITGNAVKNTKQGMEYLTKILNNPNVTYTLNETKAYGRVVDIRLPSGTGVRYSEDGNKLIGFLEPKN